MNRITLEAEPSIFEKKLLLEEYAKEEPLSSLFPEKEKNDDCNIPWKSVVPSPGFCVKFHTPEGDKIFINICYTDLVPDPKDVSEEDLMEILNSEGKEYYTVPMSIGDLHLESDKSGNLCSVYDIAISKEFFNKCQRSELFKSFLMGIAASGIEDKYKLNLSMNSQNPYVVLKNRKALGVLQVHRIQQRPVKSPKFLIEEVSPSKEVNKSTKSLIENLTLVLHPSILEPEKVIATYPVKVKCKENLQLNVGEDRIILVNLEKKYTLFDIFLPVNVDPEKTQASYNCVSHIIEIHLPLVNKVS